MRAAAKLLKAHEGDLGGTVLLLFQPAEEGGAGGKKFVEEGALRGVSGIHGIHVWPVAPAGTITSRVRIVTFPPNIYDLPVVLQLFWHGQASHRVVSGGKGAVF